MIWIGVCLGAAVLVLALAMTVALCRAAADGDKKIRRL